MVFYAEPEIGINGVLFCASDSDSLFAMPSQWLCIFVSYAEPVVGSHVVLYWTSDYESWCVILRQ
jgi:hypothetical protein